MSEPVVRKFGGDTPEAAEIMELCNMWRAIWAKAQELAGQSDGETLDPNGMSKAATAASILAGTFIGNAIVCGLMTDQDRRRAAESFARNFRSGIDIGKNQGFRVAGEMPVGGHA